MRSTPLLLTTLKTDYPQLVFHKGTDFHWDYKAQTITYSAFFSDTSWSAHLLHEVAHAELHHQTYSRDIELLAMERDAWSYARRHLSPLYNIYIDTDTSESAMDSYRDWLHARSTCPHCRANGVEIHKNTYECPACQHQWRVNEARICHLRRYQIQK